MFRRHWGRRARGGIDLAGAGQHLPTTTLSTVPLIGAVTIGLFACQPRQPPPENPESEPMAANPEARAPAPEPEPTTQDPAATAAKDVTEKDVESFARAYLAILSLEQDYGARLESAQSPEESTLLQVQAQQEMQRVLEQEGLTVDEFEAIGMAANEDEALRERVESELQELAEDPHAPEATPPPGDDEMPPSGGTPPSSDMPPLW